MVVASVCIFHREDTTGQELLQGKPAWARTACVKPTT
jgi:hypothetical protein